MDVGLPGMDGYTTSLRIREVSQVPIILVSRRDLSEDRIRGLESGADAYICKPFAPQELTASAGAKLAKVEIYH